MKARLQHTTSALFIVSADGEDTTRSSTPPLLACDSLLMDVVSPWMDFAIPKSISLSCPWTSMKLAGLRSE